MLLRSVTKGAYACGRHAHQNISAAAAATIVAPKRAYATKIYEPTPNPELEEVKKCKLFLFYFMAPSERGAFAASIWKIDVKKRERLADFGRYAAQCLPKFVQRVQFAGGDELEFLIHPSGVVPVLAFLKGHHSAQFTNFIFACGVDIPTRSQRFEVVYALLSTRFNARCRVRTYTDEIEPLESVCSVFSGAEWYEREM